MTDTAERPVTVERVFALVELQDRVVREIRDRAALQGPDAPATALNTNQPGEDRLNIYVSLSAHTSDGQHIATGTRDFVSGSAVRVTASAVSGTATADPAQPTTKTSASTSNATITSASTTSRTGSTRCSGATPSFTARPGCRGAT